MRTPRQLALNSVLVLALARSLLACSDAPATIEARLEVAEAGTYKLNGRAVAESELKHELRELRSRGAPVRLEIEAHSMAKHEAVGKAVKAAQDAGVDKLAFVTSPPLTPSSPSVGGVSR